MPVGEKKMEAAFVRYEGILDKLYELLKVNEPTPVNNAELATLIVGESKSVSGAVFMRAKQAFIDAGILTNDTTSANAFGVGRQTTITLLWDKAEAYRLWEDYKHQRRTTPRPKKEPKPKPVATDGLAFERPQASWERLGTAAPLTDDHITVAVSGPDRTESPFSSLAPLRKDEAAALLEAGRQYAKRREDLRLRIAELESSGIKMKVSLEDAFDFAVDERLETVALLLPHIDLIERQLDTVTASLRQEKAITRSLRADVESYRRAVSRASASVQPTVVHGD